MERIGTGIGSLHFDSCTTEQVKNNRTLRVLRRKANYISHKTIVYFPTNI